MKKNTETVVEIMFEKFKVPACYASVQSLLALFASGSTTGLVLDIGDEVTHTVPIANCRTIRGGILRMNKGGSDLTDHLVSLLREGGISFETTAEWDIARNIKEQLCYVPYDVRAELQHPEFNQSYTMPDGQKINVNVKMRVLTPEPLFDPSVLGLEAFKSIHKLVADSIARCDPQIQPALWNNIILCGGSSMFPGLKERLESELKALTGSAQIRVVAPEFRKYAGWLGGSLLANHSNFGNHWVFLQEWREYGPSIVHRKSVF
eukprot:TRINITY_DN1252_c0_g1_i1.p1 TRINITY_DN1252_c0_g1~~TRINITY_DN1252_c0_g1_i1.p1  ORF type:complete len:263 (-),score=49.99 TRINITY_DN1252_c0_g1_i1:34-822(-)